MQEALSLVKPQTRGVLLRFVAAETFFAHCKVWKFALRAAPIARKQTVLLGTSHDAWRLATGGLAPKARVFASKDHTLTLHAAPIAGTYD